MIQGTKVFRRVCNPNTLREGTHSRAFNFSYIEPASVDRAAGGVLSAVSKLRGLIRGQCKFMAVT